MLERFLGKHPAYAETAFLDELRARDFGRLDEHGHVYLDFTGAGLYAASQVREHAAFLEKAVFGNPHSANPTSMAATRARRERPRGGPRLVQRRWRLHRGLHFERLGRAEARSANPSPSAPAAAICSPPTTTTPSTGSASSPVPEGPGSTMRR